ncbi:Crp/Fnr family transcriptional regulator [Thiospirillum jenense]|uniref:Crp/Fnr family transcriptional regulator n=1 Tax=Thiospirillum jenense TaxID=1653858 RepID=A0A839HHX2_9GAMM|nr:Crp/Fnr family transcriptional regulator [Thiospirillum jenense]MBB1126379.1 Crp/Fnr family transcriptional regulator [Thiospirillum jenense]
MAKSVTLREAWAGDADCRTCALRTSMLFADLEAADFEIIHEPIEQFNFKAGAVLYHSGDRDEYMFTVRSGALKLVQYLADGNLRIVRLVRSGDVLGLEALLDECYQHDAVVLQPTELCRFPVQLVQTLAHDNSKLYRELMTRWQRALTEADAWLTELSTGSARQRMARLLLRLIQDSTRNTCQLFNREDMGAMLGITTETASRTVASFKREDLIIEITPTEYLLDVLSLRRIAED